MPLDRALLSATLCLLSTPLAAEAGETQISVDVAAVSALHDRGEQVTREALQFGAGVQVEVQDASVYGAVYRLLPVGSQQEAFDDEAGFTLGTAWNTETYSADISANFLTFPGEEAESTVELAGAVSIHTVFTPVLIGFYDADFEDWGLELTGGPEWEAGEWTIYALGRAGFVQPGDDSAHRSYAGVEWGAVRPVSDSVEFSLFARSDIADEESFIQRMQGGEITSMRNSGVAAGINLSISR
ncbi:hypothetical protein [Hyphomonas sp.]|uniref:hypothetical protein n=1 Tax=Hyphomonas sp. TaxID=87 RepID=UPI00391C356F